MFKAASPSQAMSEDSKSCFERSICIWTVKCNAHSFSQYYNFQNVKIKMLEQGNVTFDSCVWAEKNKKSVDSLFDRRCYSG